MNILGVRRVYRGLEGDQAPCHLSATVPRGLPSAIAAVRIIGAWDACSVRPRQDGPPPRGASAPATWPGVIGVGTEFAFLEAEREATYGRADRLLQGVGASEFLAPPTQRVAVGNGLLHR